MYTIQNVWCTVHTLNPKTHTNNNISIAIVDVENVVHFEWMNENVGKEKARKWIIS